jgi:hypothetical protein
LQLDDDDDDYDDDDDVDDDDDDDDDDAEDGDELLRARVNLLQDIMWFLQFQHVTHPTASTDLHRILFYARTTAHTM